MEKVKSKRPSTLIKELKTELHYWQGRYRMELRGLFRTAAKIREIAAEMRRIQKGEK